MLECFYHIVEQAVRLGGRHNMPPPLLIVGQFVVRGQELPTVYVRTKFEGRSFIRLRNIGTFRCAALIDPVTLTLTF